MHKITPDLYREMLKKMLQIRFFEEQVDQLYMKGEVHGTGHLYIGMEATAVGAIFALKKEDVITSTHRGHGHCIAKGAELKFMMAELLGKRTGYCKGKGGSMHIADINIGNLGANGIVGGGIAIATGAALAAKEMETGQVALCFFGDGAINQGVFHESINMASIWKLPVIYIVENNKYGMGFPVSKAVSIDKLSKRACAYGVKGITIDGNDVVGVYNTLSELIFETRSGKGPILVECETYRWKGHSRVDPERYRTKEEVDEWKKKCPILRFKKYLIDNNIITLSEIDKIEKDVMIQIKEATEFAIASPFPEPKEATEDVYA
ncbi:MAG: thiamine pyrophosphate-dependent dehydrogenase E1 component subunit alpha [Candidatus Humimicrobiaceae bacterium]